MAMPGDDIIYVYSAIKKRNITEANKTMRLDGSHGIMNVAYVIVIHDVIAAWQVVKIEVDLGVAYLDQDKGKGYTKF